MSNTLIFPPPVDLRAFEETMLLLENEFDGRPIQSLAFTLRDVSPVVEEARLLQEELKPKDAIRLLSAHLETHPENCRLMITMAKIYQAMNDIPKAYQMMERVIKTDRRLPEPHLFLIEIDLKSKFFPRAKSRIKTLGEVAPESFYHLYAKSLMAIKNGNYIEAQNLLIRAVPIIPNRLSIINRAKDTVNLVEKRLAKLPQENPIGPKVRNRPPEP